VWAELLIELMTDVVLQDRFAEFRQGTRWIDAAEPAREMQEIEGVGPQRASRALLPVFGVKEAVGPFDWLALRIQQAIGGRTRRQGM